MLYYIDTSRHVFHMILLFLNQTLQSFKYPGDYLQINVC